MTPFEKAIDFILRPDIEGVSSMDPKDPGNWTGGKVNVGELNGTKYGISAASYPSLPIQSLSREECVEIYRRDYWDKCQCGHMPSPIAIAVFDCAVNQGVGAAMRLIQEAARVKVDGVIGRLTLDAIGKANMKSLLATFIGLRGSRYAKSKNVDIYGDGWFRRAAACTIAAMEPL